MAAYDAQCEHCGQPYTFANARAVKTIRWQRYCSPGCERGEPGLRAPRRGFASMDTQRQRELANERDAVRYRWLRKRFPGDPYFVVAGSGPAWSGTGDFGAFLDAAIDKAAAGVPGAAKTTPGGCNDGPN